MRYWASDLHLGHANISRYCGRPYDTTEQMNVDLIDRINTMAGPQDELWLLGDIALGNLTDSLDHLRRLTAGRLVLVPGNHDRIHPMHGAKAAHHAQDYHAVFDTIHPSNTTTTLTDGTVVNVSHFPYWLTPTESRSLEGATPATDRFAAWRPANDGNWLICGHVHGAWATSGNQINVGVDAWNGYPLSDIDLAAIIHQHPNARSAETWKATSHA